ncbi:MAG: MATE family efflux transporter, partial [Enterobacterales bacterium]|nr:MATE family efflux transporter [Enterobacterales bacterium]
MLWQADKLKAESKTMLRLAVPAVIAQLAQMSMGTIDTVMSGNLNTESLAAISIANNLVVPLIILVLGILMALNPMVSHAMGAQQTERVADYLRQGIYVAIALTIPCILIIPQADFAMDIIGVEPTIRPIVSEYLSALSWGLLSLNLFLALRFVNEGLFSTDAIMFISLGAIPINIGLNTIFMYGHFGIPAMGAVGLGYATSIVWTLMTITLALYTIKAKKYADINFLSGVHWPSWTIIKSILKLAVPMSMTLFLEVLLFASVGLLIGRYAIDMIASHQIALNVASVIYMVPVGLSIAVTARVGHAAGRHNLTHIKRSAYLGIIFAVVFSVLMTLILVLLPRQIVSIYTQEVAVIDMTIKLLWIASVFLIVDSVQVITASALRGLHDTFVPMLIAALSYWLVGFSTGYYLAENLGLMAEGYWYGFVSGLTCSAF